MNSVVLCFDLSLEPGIEDIHTTPEEILAKLAYCAMINEESGNLHFPDGYVPEYVFERQQDAIEREFWSAKPTGKTLYKPWKHGCNVFKQQANGDIWEGYIKRVEEINGEDFAEIEVIVRNVSGGKITKPINVVEKLGDWVQLSRK